MKNHHVVIRPFQAATDLEKLSDIWLQASLRAHPFIGEQRLLEQQRLIEERYLPNSETWVASDQDTPVGFISLLGTFIGGLFVIPDLQGRGIGRKLVHHCLALKGELSLEVYTRNEQAMRFYTALGFQELSRRPVDDAGLLFENAHLHLKG